ncbi:MAG: ABC transporter permease [Thermoplasmata archaeon]|nr:ABC transporter permease [Thermoplasmata archaeon]
MIAKVALRDLAGRPGRTAGLAAVVAVLALSLVVGYMLTSCLQSGAQSVEERLGADIMVVPDGYADEAEDVLISGTPSSFYMDSSLVDRVAAVTGVEQVSAQFYLTSITDSDCCEYSVQIIGYDPDTDFTVTPWIESYYGDYENGIVVGYNIYPTDGEITLFGHTFRVSAKLSESGTGADNSVYMDMETLALAISYAQSLGYDLDLDPETQVSTILVKVEEGRSAEPVATLISFLGVDTVLASEVLSDITTSMGSLIGYVGLFQVTIVFMSAVVLAVLFSLTVYESRKEYAVLRMIGASRGAVSGVVLLQALAVGIVGALAGVVLGLVVMVPLSGVIGDALGTPFALSSTSDIIRLAATAFVISVVVGTASAAISAARIARKDAYTAFREGE